MLRMKFFEEFKNGYPFLVIIGDKEGLGAAYRFFASQKEGYLNEPSLVSEADIAPLEQSALFLTEQECEEIAEHFKNLSLADTPSHAYFDTQALGDEVEVMISYGEYEKLF
ncbi:MAG: hypothetical protein DI582_06220 [Azospirillum brasilense]|nr:MAG: hypothetical protein DI582_06220 [Azospirillum brasilense]